MKKLLLLIALFTAVTGKMSAQQTDTYFPYPIVPDSISNLQDRTDYLIAHFWDFCDLKKAFNNKQKMGEAFRQYLEFMPYASARNAYKSIAIFLKNLEKQPNDILFLAQKAEEFVHSDTAEIYSDDLFLPFARAVVEHKKISSQDKKPFEKVVKVLSYTQKGMPVPTFNYKDRQGQTKTFEPDSSEVTIIFFASPDCIDCTLARSRLKADIRASGYVKDGVMRIMVINPGSEEGWAETAEKYPEEWEVVSAPGIDEIFDVRFIPSFYVVDEQNIIHLKNINIDTLLNLISRL